jgi:hypothetical protein
MSDYKTGDDFMNEIAQKIYVIHTISLMDIEKGIFDLHSCLHILTLKHKIRTFNPVTYLRKKSLHRKKIKRLVRIIKNAEIVRCQVINISSISKSLMYCDNINETNKLLQLVNQKDTLEKRTFQLILDEIK